MSDTNFSCPLGSKIMASAYESGARKVAPVLFQEHLADFHHLCLCKPHCPWCIETCAAFQREIGVPPHLPDHASYEEQQQDLLVCCTALALNCFDVYVPTNDTIWQACYFSESDSILSVYLADRVYSIPTPHLRHLVFGNPALVADQLKLILKSPNVKIFRHSTWDIIQQFTPLIDGRGLYWAEPYGDLITFHRVYKGDPHQFTSRDELIRVAWNTHATQSSHSSSDDEGE